MSKQDDQDVPGTDQQLAAALHTAQEVLAKTLEWKLPATRWQGIDDLLDDLAAAVAADDTPDVRRFTGDLLCSGPVRARVPISADEPPPPLVRERINELIDSISPSYCAPGKRPGTPGPGPEDDDR